MTNNNNSDRADTAAESKVPAAATVPASNSPHAARPRRWGWIALLLIALAALGIFGWRKYQARHAAEAEQAAAGAGAIPGAASGPGSPASGGNGAGRRRGRGGDDANRPQPVVVDHVRAGSLRVIQPAVGTVTALATVTVRSRVDGTLDQILFKEGDTAQRGQLLARIDPRAYEVALQQAKGQLARDEAQLANARVDLERYRGLLAQDSIASQQVDTQAALARQYEATVQVDRAAVANADLQLSYTRVTAPVTGRIGLRQVDAGNLVRASDTNGIVTLTQLQPISVLFSIPEAALPRVQAALKAGKPLAAEAYDRDQRTKLATGTVASFDNQIDTSTGTVRLRALFRNDDGALFPNQFVNLRLVVDTLDNATLLPNSAVLRGTQGTFVYLVGADESVSVRPVKLGPSEGELTVATEGVAPGAVVVVEGTDKLRDGAKVEPVQRTTADNAGAQPAPRKHRDHGNGAAPASGNGARPAQ